MRRYRVGPFEVRGVRLILACSARQVVAGRRVVDTLVALIECGAGVVTKEAGLAQNVYILRRLFREHGVADAIETLPGAGYRLRVPVKVLAAPQPDRPVRRASLRIAAVAALVVLACSIPVAEHLRFRATAPSAYAAQNHRLYAIGRYYWNLRTASAVRTSMKYFEEIIRRDPQSELGYLGMADAYATMGDYCYGTHRPAIYFAQAAAYARQALIIDPRSAPAHATLGFLLLHRHERTAAVNELQRSLDADPSYAPAHEWYGLALAAEGRFDAAQTQLTQASRLAPLSLAATAWLAQIARRNGKIADARLYARDARDLGGGFAAGTLPRDHLTWAAVEEPAAAAIVP